MRVHEPFSQGNYLTLVPTIVVTVLTVITSFINVLKWIKNTPDLLTTGSVHLNASVLNLNVLFV